MKYLGNNYTVNGEETTIFIKRGNNTLSVIIDTFNLEKLVKYKWYLDARGYVTTNINRVKFKMHRLILGIDNSEILVDHKDRNRLNNKEDNLRACTYQLNAINKGIAKNNTSGVKGVWYDKPRDRWVAEITINHTKKYLGRFKSIEDAIKARVEAEEIYFKPVLEEV